MVHFFDRLPNRHENKFHGRFFVGIKGLYGFLCQRRVVCYLLSDIGIRSSNMMAK